MYVLIEYKKYSKISLWTTGLTVYSDENFYLSEAIKMSNSG